MHPALNIAIKAARRAGQIINRASNDLDLLKVSTKQPNDFVTEVDQAAEAAIITTLQEAYPQYGILAEESGASGQEQAEFQWIIDPLDGTREFSEVPRTDWAVHVALWEDGGLVAGAVARPAAGLTYATDGPVERPVGRPQRIRLAVSRTRPPARRRSSAPRFTDDTTV